MNSTVCLEADIIKCRPFLNEIGISSVFIVQALSFSGIEAVGTNSDESIFLSAKDRSGQPQPCYYMRQAFYQEMALIVLRRFSQLFPRQEWCSKNPQWFEYSADGVSAVKSFSHATAPGSSAVPGMVSQYSEACLETDVEIMFGLSVVSPDALANVLKADERASEKYRILRDFMCVVWPEMAGQMMPIQPSEEHVVPPT